MKKFGLILLTLTASFLFMADDCDNNSTTATQSASGVTKASVTVPIGADGLTAEQRNVHDRLLADNKVGAIKHLYVISAYSGQVILYSTVKGKVTSGNKRLTPATVLAQDPYQAATRGMHINIAGQDYITPEVLGDDGTYGTSGDYLYWWDVRGAYHQHYLTGGQIIHISDQPLPVKSITINIEATKE